MRVIAGSAKGRRLQAGHGHAIRPTADKVKGAAFNILASRFDLASAQVLDLFAGSGSLGIEALSRGAAHVTFVEEAAAALRVLRRNLEACGCAARARVLPLPAHRALAQLAREHAAFDGALLDPPYGRGLVDRTLALLAQRALLRPGAWVLAEHHIDEGPALAYGPLRLTHARHYGKTGVALFVADQPMSTAQKRGTNGRRAVYAGSFDPITNGHLDVVRRAADVFDELIVAVATGTSDPQKDRALFSPDERVAMIQETLAEAGVQAHTDKFSGLLVDYCERRGARVIIRGLRAVSDFEYEFQMAMMNRHLKPGIETFFMTASATYFYTASRLVKEVASLGGDVSGLLPGPVYRRLLRKLQISC
jgi:pantetheine-phosphate adenylyltransferase